MATAAEPARRTRPRARRLAELRAWVAVLRDELERRLRRGDPALTPAERRTLVSLCRMER